MLPHCLKRNLGGKMQSQHRRIPQSAAYTADRTWTPLYTTAAAEESENHPEMLRKHTTRTVQQSKRLLILKHRYKVQHRTFPKSRLFFSWQCAHSVLPRCRAPADDPIRSDPTQLISNLSNQRSRNANKNKKMDGMRT